MINFKKMSVKEERTSLPTPRQFRVGHNPSYLNSLVTGVFSPILHLPQILWFNSLWPFLVSLWMGVTFIVLSMIAGFLGKANGFIVTDVVEEGDIPEEDKKRLIDEILQGSGYTAVKAPAYGDNSGEHY